MYRVHVEITLRITQICIPAALFRKSVVKVTIRQNKMSIYVTRSYTVHSSSRQSTQHAFAPWTVHKPGREDSVEVSERAYKIYRALSRLIHSAPLFPLRNFHRDEEFYGPWTIRVFTAPWSRSVCSVFAKYMRARICVFHVVDHVTIHNFARESIVYERINFYTKLFCVQHTLTIIYGEITHTLRPSVIYIKIFYTHTCTYV